VKDRLSRLFDEYSARIRDLDNLMVMDEKREADFVLKFENLFAECGLGDVQPISRP
jgi:hypothetical protein